MILDPEPMVKIPEKTFERLLGKYRQASMAEYVTAEYEKVIGSLRDTVEALKRKLDKVTRLAERLVRAFMTQFFKTFFSHIAQSLI